MPGKDSVRKRIDIALLIISAINPQSDITLSLSLSRLPCRADHMDMRKGRGSEILWNRGQRCMNGLWIAEPHTRCQSSVSDSTIVSQNINKCGARQEWIKFLACFCYPSGTWHNGRCLNLGWDWALSGRAKACKGRNGFVVKKWHKQWMLALITIGLVHVLSQHSYEPIVKRFLSEGLHIQKL